MKNRPTLSSLSITALLVLLFFNVTLPLLAKSYQQPNFHYNSAQVSPSSSTAGSISSDADITVPSGDLRNTNEDDFLPHEPEGNFYNELWSYFIKLDNGAQILIEYSISYFGSMKDPVTGGQMAIANFNGEDYVVRREYPIDLRNFDPSNYYFRLHPERDIWFKGKLSDQHELFFRTNKGGILYDVKLNLSDIEQGVSWGNGEFVLNGKDRIGMFIHIPSAKVSGHIAMNGDSTQVKGVAYMDHTYQTRLTTDLIKKGYRYIIGNSQQGIQKAGQVLMAKNESDRTPIGYSVTRDKNQGWRLLRPSNIEADGRVKVDKVKIDDTVNITYTDGNVQLLKQDQQYLSFSLLSELGGLKKFLAKQYLGGEFFKIMGTARSQNNEEVDYNYFVVD